MNGKRRTGAGRQRGGATSLGGALSGPPTSSRAGIKRSTRPQARAAEKPPTPAESEVLEVLGREWAGPADLADELEITRPNARSRLMGLVEKGYAERDLETSRFRRK